MLGIEQIQSMFDQTFQAMDAMDNFRSKAIATMGANNKLIEAQLQRAEGYVDRVRQQQAREAVSGGDTAGPVRL
jgi:phage shock protein A